MAFAPIRPCAIFECLVMLFQLVGVAGLVVSRLAPATRWGGRGRFGFVVALVGLGVAGALCGQQGSEFGLFAGVTLTGLLMGMIVGGGSTDLACHTGLPASAETGLLG